MAHGTVGWIQVDTDDIEGAKRFYGDLFNWTFAQDPSSDRYHLATLAGAEEPHGGFKDTKGEVPNRAVFLMVVDDVAATVKQAESMGGKVVTPPTTTPTGLIFADLQDPSGNHFSVFTPPAG